MEKLKTAKWLPDEFLGGFRNELDLQCGLYLRKTADGNFVVAKYEQIHPIDDTITLIKEVGYQIDFKVPDDMSKMYWGDIQKWLENVLSMKYPTPNQISYLQFYVENPNDALTQAVLDVCSRRNCFCPLCWSPLGCIYFIFRPLKSKYKCLECLPLTQKKPVMRALSYIRQHISLEEFASWLNKLKLTMSMIEESGLVEYG